MKKIIGVLLIFTFLLMGCSYNEPQEKQENKKSNVKLNCILPKIINFCKRLTIKIQ